MNFVIVGAGAIGAFVGAMLSRAKEEVTLIARGEHLKAMQERGLRIVGPLGEFEARPVATDRLEAVADADVVLLTLKAHSVAEIAPRLSSLLKPEATVITAQNGIPWWYFYRSGGELEATHLESIDPGGIIRTNIDLRRVVGCIVYCSTIITRPGVIHHIEGTRFAIGEPDGSKSDRCRRVADAFVRAGLRCPVRNNIRRDLWIKLMGNVAYNPISALTRASLLEIVRCPETRDLARAVMNESEAVARRLGIEMDISAEQRLRGAEEVGHHKTSMLQDIEAGRPIELEPIVGAVLELGSILNVPMPHTRTLYACAKLLVQPRESA